MALQELILKEQADGHRRVIVTACHVQLMMIAQRHLERGGRADANKHVGKILMYRGSLSDKQRDRILEEFLTSPNKTVLFLSVAAGGTGLHIVPSEPETKGKEEFCRSIIFWGSRPFSPMQVKQTYKRIHRIGQRFECNVHHLIAYGSVDHAITGVHEDKSRLAGAIVDDDWSSCDQAGGNWRQKGRIVDMCCPLMEDGNFPSRPGSPVDGVVVPPARHTTSASSIAGSAGLQPVAPLQSKFFRQPLSKAAVSAASSTVSMEVDAVDAEAPTAAPSARPVAPSSYLVPRIIPPPVQASAQDLARLAAMKARGEARERKQSELARLAKEQEDQEVTFTRAVIKIE